MMHGGNDFKIIDAQQAKTLNDYKTSKLETKLPPLRIR
jgi:hypothetical protein